MLDLLETPTFVVDDLFDSRNIKLFDYLEFEKIPFEVLELCSADLPYRQGAYYPVVIDEIEDDHELFANINPRALLMAQEQNLIIVFIYTGNKNLVFSLKGTLIGQLMDNFLDFHNIRIVSQVSPIAAAPAYIYFSFAEMEAYMEAQSSTYVDGFCENDREKVFTCNVAKDTAHSRLFCASAWYHALINHSYLNYPPQATDNSITSSPAYRWNKHWSATETLIDMLGQQLPIVQTPGCELDFYNNAYWNFCMMDTFSSNRVMLGKSVFLPILNLQPFVIVGPGESLKLLRTLGYKTFKKQVNETYDDILDDEERMQSLFRLVYEMSHFTGEELNQLNEVLRSTIVHNQTHFLSSKKYKLITLLNLLKTGSY